jgi:hypothetical protein
MDTITAADLSALLGIRTGPCVSIFLPARRGGGDDAAGQLARCLDEAERNLEAPHSGLFRPARALLGDEEFWRHQEGGLAVFLAPGLFRAYRLPVAFAERVAVGEEPALTPILPLVSVGHFFVLALSKGGVRLFRCGPGGAAEVEVPGCPRGVEGAMAGHDSDEMLNYHTRHVGGRSEATYHGNGVGTDDRKDDVRRYFLAVERALRPVLRGEDAPVFLAGVAYLLPMFRTACSYAHLAGVEIHGSPDRMSARELFERALPLARPYLEKALEGGLDLYGRLAGTGRTASGAEAAAAAVRGEAEVLFVREGESGWAEYAAAEALRHGGRAHVLPAARMPCDSPLAAVLRLPHQAVH